MLTQNQIDLRSTAHHKPHIYLHDGYWRVSRMPKPYWKYRTNFASAHFWAVIKNQLRNKRNG